MADPNIKVPAGYSVVRDADGYLVVADVQAHPAAAALSVATAYAAARVAEASTRIGAGALVAGGPLFAQQAFAAAAHWQAGDYAGFVANAVPALVGVAGSVAAMLMPEKCRVPSDADIQAAVKRMPIDDLVQLLAGPLPAQNDEGSKNG